MDFNEKLSNRLHFTTIWHGDPMCVPGWKTVGIKPHISPTENLFWPIAHANMWSWCHKFMKVVKRWLQTFHFKWKGHEATFFKEKSLELAYSFTIFTYNNEFGSKPSNSKSYSLFIELLSDYFLKMDEEEISPCLILCKFLDPKELHISDREGDIFNPILFVTDLN